VKLEHIINNIYNNKQIIILVGDFNCDLLANTPQSAQLVNIFDSYGMTPFISQPTRVTATSHTLLDNLVSNYNPLKAKSKTHDLCLSDHFAIETIFELNTTMTQIYSSNYFNTGIVSTANISHLCSLLRQESWTDVYGAKPLNDSFDYFYSKFLYYFNCAIPNIRKKVNHGSHKEVLDN
jgi:hypothetical protein